MKAATAPGQKPARGGAQPAAAVSNKIFVGGLSGETTKGAQAFSLLACLVCEARRAQHVERESVRRRCSLNRAPPPAPPPPLRPRSLSGLAADVDTFFSEFGAVEDSVVSTWGLLRLRDSRFSKMPASLFSARHCSECEQIPAVASVLEAGGHCPSPRTKPVPTKNDPTQVMVDETGKSRGFGFVTFAEEAPVKKLLLNRVHSLNVSA